MHFGHELTYAKWDQLSGKWTIRIRCRAAGTAEGEEFEETCDVLLLCVGSLHRWHWPDIPGLGEFGGKLLHSTQFNADKDIVKGERVGVVGNVSRLQRIW